MAPPSPLVQYMYSTCNVTLAEVARATPGKGEVGGGRRGAEPLAVTPLHLAAYSGHTATALGLPAVSKPPLANHVKRSQCLGAVTWYTMRVLRPQYAYSSEIIIMWLSRLTERVTGTVTGNTAPRRYWKIMVSSHRTVRSYAQRTVSVPLYGEGVR